MNNRQKMIKSNRMAREYFLDEGYTWIAFKPHTKMTDVVWNRKFDGFGNTDYKGYQTDHFNLFDGYMLGTSVIWFQVKTNAWAKAEPVKKWCSKYNQYGIIINVTNKLKSCNGKWVVLSREYNFE